MNRLCLALLVAGISAASFAQSESANLRAELQQHYRSFDAAIGKADQTAFFRLFHPSYTEVNTQGHSRNFAQFKAAAKGMMASMKNVSSKSTLVHAQGGLADEATAWVSVTIRFSVNKGGKWVPMKLTKRFTDTLKRGGNGWLFTYSQELPMDEPWPFKG